MSVIDIKRRVLEVGCQLLIPTRVKKIVCLNTEENSTIILFIPDIRVIAQYFNDWLELNDI